MVKPWLWLLLYQRKDVRENQNTFRIVERNKKKEKYKILFCQGFVLKRTYVLENIYAKRTTVPFNV